MATTAKAIAMAQELKDELKLRTGLAVALKFDADQNPLIQIGTGVAGAKGALVKIMPLDWPLAKDILGLSSPVYTPHKIQVAFEAMTIVVNNTGADTVTDPNTWAEKLAILAALSARGCKIELFESAAGDSPDADDLIDGNLKASYQASLKYPLAGQ